MTVWDSASCAVLRLLEQEACAVCGFGRSRQARRAVRRVFLGRVAVYTREEWVCTVCGKAYTDDAQGKVNAKAESAAIIEALARIGPRELRAARKLSDATQSQMEAILGVGKNTVARWETGQRPIPRYIQATIRLIAFNPVAAILLRPAGSSS